MIQSSLFYFSRVLLFLPATLFALAMLVAEGSVEYLKWYAIGPAAVLVYGLIARRFGPDAGEPVTRARGRGFWIFALLQFHWLLLLVPVVAPAYFWLGLAALAVVLGGVFSRTARPPVSPALILLALGLIIALVLGGELPLKEQGDLPRLRAWDPFGFGSVDCFWSLFFSTRACTLAESFPEGLWIGFLVLVLLQRQYLYEGLTALALGVAVGLSNSWNAAALVASLSLALMLLPGRERRSRRAWWIYTPCWVGTLLLLNFSNYLVPDLHFYFKNTGGGNSWLFWAAGFFLAELASLAYRIWAERRKLLR